MLDLVAGAAMVLGHMSARVDHRLHVPLVGYVLKATSAVCSAVPSFKVLAILDEFEDAVSREVSVAVVLADGPNFNTTSREISVGLVDASPMPINAQSREVAVGRAEAPSPIVTAASREVSVLWDPNKIESIESREISVGGKAPLNIEVEFQDVVSGSAPTTAKILILDSDGTVYLDSIVNLTAGKYLVSDLPRRDLEVYANASHWLRKKMLVKHGSTNAVTLSLQNGDIDLDNAVTLLDYDIFSAYYDKTDQDADWTTVGPNGFAPEDADLDEDGSVKLLDYDIFSKNYDSVGD